MKPTWADMPEDGSPMIEWALWYASNGIAVFPVKPRTKTGYYRYDKYPGKTGSPYSWQAQASTDPDRVRRFWTDHPAANIGGLMGRPSGGLYSLDFDIEHVSTDKKTGKEYLVRDGKERLREWEQETGLKINDDTAISTTGSGGQQYFYFADPEKLPGDGGGGSHIFEATAGNDTRGDGNYCVLPPSIHPNGRRYEWDLSPEDYPPAAADEAFYEYWKGKGRTEGRGKAPGFEELKDVAGGRHDALKSYIAGVIAKTKGKLAREEYEAILEMANNSLPVPVGLGEDDDPDEYEKTVAPMVSSILSREMEKEDVDWKAAMREWRKKNPGKDFDGNWDAAKEDWEAAGKPRLKKADDQRIEAGWKNHKDTQGPGNALIDALKKVDAIHKYRTHDRGHGSLFADIYRDKYRYCGQKRDYMEYNGKKWITDVESLKTKRAAQEFSEAIIRYAIDEDDGEGKPYLKAVTRLSDRRSRANMLEDAKPIYPINAADLDSDDYLLNVGNCTLDLSGEKPVVKSHDPDDLLSKICNADYDPEAQCPLWEKFMREVMQGDKDKIRYLQKLAGLCLTGNTEREACDIFYGATTRNGKGTWCETILYLLGDYAVTMRPESLATKANKDSRQASGDIARLAGCRFVNASEPPKRMLFDTALLKNLTGGDTITARHLHERDFEFKPKFKLVINTNYLPLISDDSVFSSDRINVVSFDRHFSESERDRSLKGRLKDPAELSGILNWCLEGWRLYQMEGLEPPDVVRQATENYRRDSDKVGNFINECLKDSAENSKVKEVYEAYVQWCKDSGHGIESKANFIADMKAKGLFAQSGRVHGLPTKNIIKGYVVEGVFKNLESDRELPDKFR